MTKRIRNLDDDQSVRTFTRRRVTAGRDEAGAVLILAMVFLVSAGMVIMSLVGWSGNDLLNTSHFNTIRSVNYGAGGATEIAIWGARYTYPSTVGSAVPCLGTDPSVEIDGQYFEDFCETTVYPLTTTTRVVQVTACPLPSSTGLSSPCTNWSLQAVVTFDDYNDLNVDQCSSSMEGSCGTGMTLDSWDVK